MAISAATLLASHAAGAPRHVDPRVAMASRICQAVVHVEPGEAHHAACLESLAASLAAAGLEARSEAVEAALPGLVIPGGRRSYSFASFEDTRGRYRLACQLAGFDPERSGLDGCVTGLAAAMAAADNPQP